MTRRRRTYICERCQKPINYPFRGNAAEACIKCQGLSSAELLDILDREWRKHVGPNNEAWVETEDDATLDEP